MALVEKQSKIDIPIRLILSKDGLTYFFKNNCRVHKFKLSDNREEYGIELVDFTPKPVQKMLTLGYINKIEFPIMEVAPYRGRIIDFTKLVTYGMLYMEFGTDVFELIVKSQLVRAWNRKNVKLSIAWKTEFNHKVLNNFIQKNISLYNSLKNDIIGPVLTEGRKKGAFPEEELNKQRMIADKFLSQVNPLVWFLLITYNQTAETKRLIENIRIHLLEYLIKSSVAEFFAFMLIEVLMSIRQMMDEPGNEGNGREIEDNLFILWKFKKEIKREGDRGKLHVIISNNRSKFEEVRSSIHYRAGQSVKAKNLHDFYTAESGIADGSHLGLYYLSFFEDACKNMDLKFESFVNFDRANQQTLINLILTF